MRCKDILFKHSQQVLSNYFNYISKDLNEKIYEIERYQKLIISNLIEKKYNNTTSINLNSLKKIIDLENRLIFNK